MEKKWTISGELIELRPLEVSHIEELTVLASDPRIWEYYTIDGSNEARFNAAMLEALEERENGRQYPFVIFHKAENRIIGSTRFLGIQEQHRKLEIGWTGCQ